MRVNFYAKGTSYAANSLTFGSCRDSDFRWGCVDLRFRFLDPLVFKGWIFFFGICRRRPILWCNLLPRAHSRTGGERRGGKEK
jgi:hypothetical protein